MTALVLAYKGPSMTPTLRELDQLEVDECPFSEVRAGDVIVFRPEQRDRVVHRVIAIGKQGALTRGDHALHLDPWRVTEGEFVGRVVNVKRGSRRVAVASGSAGLRHARWLFLRHLFLRKLLKAPLRIFYRAWLRWLPPYRVFALNGRLRVAEIVTPAGKDRRLLLGKRVVGRGKPESETWKLSAPWALFIDPARLPQLERTPPYSAP